MDISDKEFLSYMLAAPAGEIENMCPAVEDLQKFLGLPENVPYRWDIHYVQVLAKLRREWAQAMLDEVMFHERE